MDNKDSICPICGNKLDSDGKCSVCVFDAKISTKEINDISNDIPEEDKKVIRNSKIFYWIASANLYCFGSIMLAIVLGIVFSSVIYSNENTLLHFIQLDLVIDYLFVSVIAYITTLLNKLETGCLYGKIRYIILTSFIIGFIVIFFLVGYNPNTNNNTTPNEKENLENEEVKIDPSSRLDYVAKQLTAKEYEQRDNCYNQVQNKDICYYNNEYTFILKNDNYIQVTKEINDLNNFDSKKDLDFFEELIDSKNYSIHANNLNNLSKSIANNKIYSYKIKTNPFEFSQARYSKTAIYTLRLLSYNYENKFLPVEIDATLNNQETLHEGKKDLYEAIASYNKDLLMFYDFPYIHFNKEDNNICKINYHDKSRYTMESSFCHGAASNTSFAFKIETEIDYNYLELNVKGSYFREMYLDIINKDINYINEKINSNIKLYESHMTSITNYISNGFNYKYNLKINNDLEIELIHPSDDTNDYYIIRYKII